MKKELFSKIVDSLIEMDMAELGDRYNIEIDAAVIKAVAAHHLEDALKYKAEGKDEAYAASIEDLEELVTDDMVGADEELTQFVQDALDQAQADEVTEPVPDEEEEEFEEPGEEEEDEFEVEDEEED